MLFRSAIAYSVETLVVAIAFLLYANRGGLSFRLRDATRAECSRLLRESWPLIFAGLSVAIYMRIDQIMIGEMLGDSAVGIFSAAVRISEVWYFVPLSIMASVAPALTTLHQQSPEAYERKFISVMRLLVLMAILVAIVLTFLAPQIISLLYGPGYEEAASVLVIHGWAGVFVGLGLASGIWLSNAGLLKYSLYQTLAGAVVNIGANIVLIPKYGIVGAAIGTVLSQMVAAYLFDLFNPKTRSVFWMKTKSFMPFYRYKFKGL